MNCRVDDRRVPPDRVPFRNASLQFAGVWW
jgi:hypothetical protein